MRLAISTGGGDAPGLNAVIRAATLSALDRGWTVLGIKRGYAGLLGEDEVIPMTAETVKGIAHLGGTILRTTNRGNPFSFPVQQRDGTWKEVDRSDELIENARNLGIQALISIGGDGSLAITGRSKEVIITGGLNVNPREVELALESYAGVSAAAVVGAPSERWGEEVVAFVVAESGRAPNDVDLIAHARTRLAAYKCPKRVITIGELPMNAIGKLDRERLRELALGSGS